MEKENDFSFVQDEGKLGRTQVGETEAYRSGTLKNRTYFNGDPPRRKGTVIACGRLGTVSTGSLLGYAYYPVASLLTGSSIVSILQLLS